MLSQPSVSLQIQALELEFKAKLFQRRGPKIQLTPDGQALYKLAWPLVEAVDSLPASFHASRERHGVRPARTSPPANRPSSISCPRRSSSTPQAYPGIELRLQNVTGRDGLKMLRNDAVDFAVGSMIEVPEDISYTPTFRYDPMLITARDHPLASKPKVTIKDVAQYPLILPPQHLTTWRVVDYVFHKYGLNYRVALEAGGWEVIKRYVGTGPGHLDRHQRLPDRQGGSGRDPVQSLLSPAHLRRRAAQGQARLPPGDAVHRDAHIPCEGEAPGGPGPPERVSGRPAIRQRRSHATDLEAIFAGIADGPGDPKRADRLPSLFLRPFRNPDAGRTWPQQVGNSPNSGSRRQPLPATRK